MSDRERTPAEDDGMTTVFALWHDRDRENDDQEEETMIGIFSTEAKAWAAVDQVKDDPKFRINPKGFEVLEWRVNRISWEEGFAKWRDGQWVD